MKTQSSKNILLTVLASLYAMITFAQPGNPIRLPKPPFVDFDVYEKLVAEVKQHRKTRLLTAQEFSRRSQSDKHRVIILDTRSDSAYAAVHIKGAVHLNFSDFTQENLAKIIPSPDYEILIYCNNNFNITNINPALVDEKRFAQVMATKSSGPTIDIMQIFKPPITLALNIPTYINLYGYGYTNVYELGELVSTYDGIIEFEGTAVK
jgi:hypothetical protein